MVLGAEVDSPKQLFVLVHKAIHPSPYTRTGGVKVGIVSLEPLKVSKMSQ